MASARAARPRRCCRLLDRCPILEAGHEPALALLRGAVGEAVGHHVALRLPLQRVVADRGGGAQRGFDVAGLDERRLSLASQRSFSWLAQTPARQSACSSTLHLDLVGLGLAAGGALQLLRLRQDAEQVLHVMADLVRDHIGLRELAGLAADVAAAEAGRDLIEERGVEIDLLVGRAIERPHRATAPRRRTGRRSRRGRSPGPAPGRFCHPWRRCSARRTSVLPSTLLTKRPMSSCGEPVRRAVGGDLGWLGPVRTSAPPISRLGSMPSAQPTRPSTTMVPMPSPPPPIRPKPPPPPE